jgi:hypothetical protein
MQIVSVQDLENRLNNDSANMRRGIKYNFFSNLAKDLQDSIKHQVFVPGSDPLAAFPLLSANLFSDEELFSSLHIPNTTIWHDGLIKDSFTQLSSLQVGSSQVGFTQVRSPQIQSTQISSTQVSPIQPSLIESGSSQINLGQISTFQVAPTQTTASEIRSSQIGVFQTSISQSGITQISTSQNSSFKIELLQPFATEVNSAQINTIQDSRQINSSKVSLPSSISSEQFFSAYSGHNVSPTSIYNINNTVLTFWNSYFQSPTPFNLNIEIADLPTGQLAEANITGFDPTGHPNSGTLYLDTDANGLGWYIDPTPWDNSEYSQTLTNTAYRATLGSDAYNHYDLLITILHETAHLQGFIAGYSNYDTHIQTLNGSKNFVGNSFSAILTPDGSHLNFQVNTQCPYPLQKGYRVHTSLKHFLQ